MSCSLGRRYIRKILGHHTMKGDYTRWTFRTKKDFGGVIMQQGRVQLDSDSNENLDVQVDEEGLLYLDAWQRMVPPFEDGSLREVAPGGPVAATGSENSTSADCKLRLTREVLSGGDVSSALQIRLGVGDVRSRGRFLLPQLEITVDNHPWRRVGSFSGSGPSDQVYVLDEDGGSSWVRFGNGEEGATPPSGSVITGTYRFREAASSLTPRKRK